MDSLRRGRSRPQANSGDAAEAHHPEASADVAVAADSPAMEADQAAQPPSELPAAGVNEIFSATAHVGGRPAGETTLLTDDGARLVNEMADTGVVEDWRIDVDGTTIEPRSTLDVLYGLSDKVARGELAEYQAMPLGFSPLDRSLAGGIRPGELVLIGGAQGTGKTTLALQMARNIALAGQASVLYVCFEHDDEYLLNRMIAMESVLGGPMPPTSGLRIQDVRREVLGTWMSQGAGDSAELADNARLRPAMDRIARYGQGLFLMRGSQTTTTVANLRRLVQAHRALAPERQLVVFVDYLQKVPVIPDSANETERITTVVNGLKDVALSEGVALVSIVAADKEGLKASRLRNHHLRGSSAINYEADVIMILNEKYHIVAKVNIEFNPYQAQRFRDWVVLTVEKNRSGSNSFDLEFEKHFEFSCFDPNGRQVQEKLIEERLYND